MEPMQSQTPSSDMGPAPMAQEPMPEQAMQEDVDPLDSLISQVDSYIADPSKITPDTLMDLKAALMDMKGIGSEEAPAGPPDMGAADDSLSSDIMRRRTEAF